MDSPLNLNVHLGREDLKGRSFILGNKRAFSVSLPAAVGSTDALLHPHKWCGAYLYGRKFLEGQIVRAYGEHEYFLSCVHQKSFTMGLISARRDYEVEGKACTEELFVPDGVKGLACTLSGDLAFAVEPEFDLRFARALSHETAGYQVELLPRGAIVSNVLPGGRFDDFTETFLPTEDGAEPVRIFAAVEIVGEAASVELMPQKRQIRRKSFRKDQSRHRAIVRQAPEEAKHDHAPLWSEGTNTVFAPLRLHVQGGGTVFYGFGASREEALAELEAVRDNLLGFTVQKHETATGILDHARFATGNELIDRAYAQVLIRLTDALVARNAIAEDTTLTRPATMILAGNRYFHDSWKRDENIALGFLLSLGFYDIARDVIDDTWQLQDPASGRLPQRIRAGEEPPYHSSDGTLWALLRLYQYWRCTGDETFLRDKLPLVEKFFRRSLERTVDGMLPSGRTTTSDYLWETWMDTPHTPRDGFPVEIQMLWIACLRHYRPLLHGIDPWLENTMEAAEVATWKALQRFSIRGMPADSLDEQLNVRDLITPNPFFCFGVGLDLGPEVERAMRTVGRRQLAGRQGIRTLAPEDWSRVFSAELLSDRSVVRGRSMRSIGKFNYHRGVEWNWLTQFFVLAELKYGEPDSAFRTYLRNQVTAVLERAGIGGISELHDLGGTLGPEYQAWSMSGFLESLHAFAGVRIDVPGRRIVIESQLPEAWPQVSVRKWYGAVPIDVTYRRDGHQHDLRVEFPWGEVPDAEIDIALVLPAGHAVELAEVRLDDIPQAPVWCVEPLLGGRKVIARSRLPAARSAVITLQSKRVASTRILRGA